MDIKRQPINRVYKETINLDDIHYDSRGNIATGKGIIKEKIVCLRPGHKSGLVQVYSEKKGDKVITHNYGHGGNGLSLLFSTVDLSIRKFLASITEDPVDFNEEITIIGLGCVGLNTAIKLYEKGFRNIKLIGEKTRDIPSYGAGGLLDIFNFDETKGDTANRLFEQSYKEYLEILNGTHKFIKKGIKPIEFFTNERHQVILGLDYLVLKGIIPKPDFVKLCLNDKNEFDMRRYKTLHVITDTFMDEMTDVVTKRLKIPAQIGTANSFDEIDSKYIFNCTGLGSLKINKDEHVFPICGHGMKFSDNSIGNRDYIIVFTKIPGLENSPVQGSLYFMPKLSGFIGGSYMKVYYGDDEEVNQKMFNYLFQRARFIFNGIKPEGINEECKEVGVEDNNNNHMKKVGGFNQMTPKF